MKVIMIPLVVPLDTQETSHLREEMKGKLVSFD